MRCDWCRRFGRWTSSRWALPFPGPKPAHAGPPAARWIAEGGRTWPYSHAGHISGAPARREGPLVLATYGNASSPWLLLAKDSSSHIATITPHRPHILQSVLCGKAQYFLCLSTITDAILRPLWMKSDTPVTGALWTAVTLHAIR